MLQMIYKLIEKLTTRTLIAINTIIILAIILYNLSYLQDFNYIVTLLVNVILMFFMITGLLASVGNLLINTELHKIIL